MKPILPITIVAASILSFILGLFMYPLLGFEYEFKPIHFLPLIALFFLLFGMILFSIMIFAMKEMDRRLCLLWLPLLLSQTALFLHTFVKYKYCYYQYRNGEYIITDKAITNKFGINILEFEQECDIDIVGEFALCWTWHDNYALYSLKEKRMLISPEDDFRVMKIINQDHALCKRRDDNYALYSLKEKRMLISPEEDFRVMEIINQDHALCKRRDDNYALYSLKEKRMLISPEEDFRVMEIINNNVYCETWDDRAFEYSLDGEKLFEYAR